MDNISENDRYVKASLLCAKCGEKFEKWVKPETLFKTGTSKNTVYCLHCTRRINKEIRGRNIEEIDAISRANIKQPRVFTREEISAIEHTITPPMLKKQMHSLRPD